MDLGLRSSGLSTSSIMRVKIVAWVRAPLLHVGSRGSEYNIRHDGNREQRSSTPKHLELEERLE